MAISSLLRGMVAAMAGSASGKLAGEQIKYQRNQEELQRQDQLEMARRQQEALAQYRQDQLDEAEKTRLMNEQLRNDALLERKAAGLEKQKDNRVEDLKFALPFIKPNSTSASETYLQAILDRNPDLVSEMNAKRAQAQQTVSQGSGFLSSLGANISNLNPSTPTPSNNSDIVSAMQSKVDAMPRIDIQTMKQVDELKNDPNNPINASKIASNNATTAYRNALVAILGPKNAAYIRNIDSQVGYRDVMGQVAKGRLDLAQMDQSLSQEKFKFDQFKFDKNYEIALRNQSLKDYNADKTKDPFPQAKALNSSVSMAWKSLIAAAQKNGDIESYLDEEFMPLREILYGQMNASKGWVEEINKKLGREAYIFDPKSGNIITNSKSGGKVSPPPPPNATTGTGLIGGGITGPVQGVVNQYGENGQPVITFPPVKSAVKSKTSVKTKTKSFVGSITKTPPPK